MSKVVFIGGTQTAPKNKTDTKMTKILKTQELAILIPIRFDTPLGAAGLTPEYCGKRPPGQ